MSVELSSPAILPAPVGYSHVAVIPPRSRLVWLAGQVPLTADGKLASGDWEGQARQVMQNVGAALTAASASWDDVFKLTIYVVDMAGLSTIRSVRDEFVNTEHPPTSTLVQVVALARPDLLLEVEAVAAVAESDA
jgi:enamine deaminase RidA (YjgF/YER057c/UK114 family)